MTRQRKVTGRALNGVDVEKLKSTQREIQAAPSQARLTFRVSNRWLTGGLNRTTVGRCGDGEAQMHETAFVIDSSEPSQMAGDGVAPSPVDYLLHALVACLTTTFVYHASMQGVRVRAIESQVEGVLDVRSFLGLRENVPGGFEAVSVRFRVAADCPEETLLELMDAARRRSPVANFVVRAVPTSVVCESM